MKVIEASCFFFIVDTEQHDQISLRRCGVLSEAIPLNFNADSYYHFADVDDRNSSYQVNCPRVVILLQEHVPGFEHKNSIRSMSVVRRPVTT